VGRKEGKKTHDVLNPACTYVRKGKKRQIFTRSIIVPYNVRDAIVDSEIKSGESKKARGNKKNTAGVKEGEVKGGGQIHGRINWAREEGSRKGGGGPGKTLVFGGEGRIN